MSAQCQSSLKVTPLASASDFKGKKKAASAEYDTCKLLPNYTATLLTYTVAFTKRSDARRHLKGQKELQEWDGSGTVTHLYSALVLLLHVVALLAPFPALVRRASANASAPERGCNTFGPTLQASSI